MRQLFVQQYHFEIGNEHKIYIGKMIKLKQTAQAI